MDLQDRWTVRLLKLLGNSFYGATAYGRGVGVWKERGKLRWDRVTVLEWWIDPELPTLARDSESAGHE